MVKIGLVGSMLVSLLTNIKILDRQRFPFYGPLPCFSL